MTQWSKGVKSKYKSCVLIAQAVGKKLVRTCTACKEEKPVGEFSNQQLYLGMKHGNKCRACSKAAEKTTQFCAKKDVPEPRGKD